MCLWRAVGLSKCSVCGYVIPTRAIQVLGYCCLMYCYSGGHSEVKSKAGRAKKNAPEKGLAGNTVTPRLTAREERLRTQRRAYLSFAHIIQDAPRLSPFLLV